MSERLEALRKPHFDSFTGLRTIAAAAVFGFHVSISPFVDQGLPGQALDWFFGQGAAGFSLFFVMSGFLLTWVARDGEPAGRLFVRRAARIYPTHIAVWLLTLAAILVATGGIGLWVWLPNLLLVQAWIPDNHVYYGMNSVTWSLGCQLLFYALFPLLLRGVRALSSGTLWPALAAAFAVIWLVPVAAHPLPDDLRYWAIWVLPIARMPEFIAGMIIARLVAEGRFPAIPIPLAGAAAIGAALASRFLPYEFGMVAGASIPMAAVVGSVAVRDLSGQRSVLRSRPMVWMGSLAFAFYLIHQVVVRVAAKVLGGDHTVWIELGLVALTLVAATAAALILHRGIEVPLSRLARSGQRRMWPVSVSSVATSLRRLTRPARETGPS